MSKILKSDIVVKVAEENNLTKAAAKQIVESGIQIVANALQAGDEVAIMGFGNFKVKGVKERNMFGASSHKQITVPAHKKVKFTPGKALKASVQ